MKLVPLQSVLDAIGFEAGLEDAAIENAIHSATGDLETILRTEFARASVTDLFFTPEANVLKLGGAGYRVSLALSRGLVVGSVTVTYATTTTGLTEDPITPDAAKQKVGAEKGVLVLLDTDVNDCYIQATYTAGIEVDDTEADLYDQDQVPTWLKEAAVAQAIIRLDSARPQMRSDSKVPVNVDVLKRSVCLNTEPRIRYFPAAVHPLV